MKKVLLAFALIIPLSISANAQAVDGCGSLHEDILNLSEGLVNTTALYAQRISGPPTTPSLVVGIVTPEDSYLLLLGDTDLGLLGENLNGVQSPAGDSVYPLSSLSKLLTGLIAAQGVREGNFSKITLVRDLVSNGALRDAITAGATIGQTISHYGGYTNLPTNMTGPTESPARNYSRQQLTDCLNNLACSYLFPPGTQYSYSNLGVGLLGLALSDFFGYENYGDLLTNKLTNSLGMPDTQRNESPYNDHLVSRIVTGFNRNGVQYGPAHMGVLAGSGEILSTGDDMLVFLKALAKPSSVQKSWFLEATTAIGSINETKDIGYGIEILPLAGGHQAYAKAGAQVAYSSFIAWSTEMKSGVFMLANRGELLVRLAPESIHILELIEEAYDLDGVGDVCLLDDDGDGVADIDDNCPSTANPEQTDTDLDGVGDVCDPDDDGDGIADGADNCALVANPSQNDADGDGLGDACDSDLDGDGFAKEVDNCPAASNPDQADTDQDGIGDECDTDDDNDGLQDANDNCSAVQNPGQDDLDFDGIGDFCDADLDGDGVENQADNCAIDANVGQDDTDGDGIGDVCDADADNDSVGNDADNCPLMANLIQNDSDDDGLGDACDSDLDGDSVGNGADNCPNVANPGQTDFDGDGLGDACDGDADGDGVGSSDQCAATPIGTITDPAHGCSIAQLCPCEGPRGTVMPWRNHGKYVSCVAHAASDFEAQGLISRAAKDAQVSAAGQSSCGK